MNKVVQIAIVVKDIEAASKRWSAVLGLPESEIRTTRPGGEVRMTVRGKPSEARAKLAFFKTGQVVIELIEPVGGPSSWQEILDAKGEGLHHIGFQVEDLKQAKRDLEAAGYENVHEGRYDRDDGTYVYYDTLDDLGATVELLHSDPKPDE
jgi:catechol 2,3-dioxygenase-like lactoylglutathione lyase family enzyme